LTWPRNAERGKRRRSDLSQMAAKGAALRLSVANALVISDRLVAVAVLPRSCASKVVAAWLMAPAGHKLGNLTELGMTTSVPDFYVFAKPP
jgi:hypothetical protein